jgi:hypothetical protein
MLRRYTGNPNASWSSVGQAKAVAYTLSRSSSLLAMLPTGGRKSIIFNGVSLIESSTTVVVFPLQALMHDQLSQAERDGFPMVRWAHNLRQPDPSIIAVSVEEAAMDTRFMDWCIQEHGNRKLNRVVVDEAHLLCTSRGYPEAMDHMNKLTTIGMPLVVLSVTLPPCIESCLNAQLGRPSWAVIREPTQHHNITLLTAKYRSEYMALNALENHVRRYEQQLKQGEGILIMCRTRDNVSLVSGHLVCPSYTSQMPEHKRKEVLDNWLRGEETMLVGTSGLGTGVNHKRCRVVFHFGIPYGAVGYAQETGRGGRDGLPALVILMHWSPCPPPPESSDNDGGYHVLLQMLEDVCCIRSLMSLYLDGKYLQNSCAGTGFAPCGRCIHSIRRAETCPGWLLQGPEYDDEGVRLFDGLEWVQEDLPSVPSRAEASTTAAIFPPLPDSIGMNPPKAGGSSQEGVGPKSSDSSQVDTDRAYGTQDDDMMDIDEDDYSGSNSDSDKDGMHVNEQDPVALPSTAVRRRRFAAMMAGPPHDVGSQVLWDVQANEMRQQDARKIEVSEEQNHWLYNFASLMQAKDALESRYVHCTVHSDSILCHNLKLA